MVAKMMVLMKMMMMMVVTIWWSSDGAIQNSSRCSRTFFPFIWPFKAAKLLVPLLFVGLISVSSATFWKPTQPSIKALKGLWKRFQPLWSVSGKTNWKLLSRNFGAKAIPCNCKCKIWLNVNPKKYSNIWKKSRFIGMDEIWHPWGALKGCTLASGRSWEEREWVSCKISASSLVSFPTPLAAGSQVRRGTGLLPAQPFP